VFQPTKRSGHHDAVKDMSTSISRGESNLSGHISIVDAFDTNHFCVQLEVGGAEGFTLDVVQDFTVAARHNDLL